MLEQLKKKIILFIGAGASKPFKIPDMKGFVNELKKGIKTSQSADLQNLWYFVRDTVPPREDMEKDIEWILRFLYLLTDPELDFCVKIIARLIRENGVLSDKDLKIGGSNTKGERTRISSILQEVRRQFETNIRQKAIKLIDVIKKFIRERCVDFEMGSVVKRWNPVFDCLYRLVGDDLWVFTTNYDLVLESYCQSEEIKEELLLCRGFVPQENMPGQVWQPGILTRKKSDVINSLRIRSTDDSKRLLRLFKLHGSCDWLKTEQGIFQFGVVGDLRLPGSMQYANLLIYPGPKREVHEEPFVELFSSFKKTLSESDRCIVFGFSFRDEHITPLFKERFVKNSNFRLAILDPKAENLVNDYFSQHKNRVIFIPFEFGEDDWEQIYSKLVKSLNV